LHGEPTVGDQVTLEKNYVLIVTIRCLLECLRA
jgi:hypothetical protein